MLIILPIPALMTMKILNKLPVRNLIIFVTGSVKTYHLHTYVAQLLALTIATVISEAGSKEFSNKISILKKVLQCWENRKSVCVFGKEGTANNEFDILHHHSAVGLQEVLLLDHTSVSGVVLSSLSLIPLYAEG